MSSDRAATNVTRIRRQLARNAPEGSWVITDVQIAAYTASIGEMVRCNPTAGGFTVTMPTALYNEGRMVAVKNSSSSTNTITIDGKDSETIDGAANTTIITGYGSVTLVSDGTNWLTLA
jgi:uncharacterized protein involved in propanediol utilization